MDNRSITENYLEKVIVFKANLEASSGYLNEQQRNQLLDDLLISLNIDKKKSHLRFTEARKAFSIYRMCTFDHPFMSRAPKEYDHHIHEFIKKAIALDPFNLEYLKEYVFHKSGSWIPESDLKARYASLFKPASEEFVEAMIELGLEQHQLNYDYLSATVTSPFVEAIMLMEQTQVLPKYISDASMELKKIAISENLEISSQDIEGTLTQLLETANLVIDHPMVDWESCRKGFLSMKQALDLAPYDIEVLATAIRYYGGLHWRILFGVQPSLGNSDTLAKFNKTVFDDEKPNPKLRHSFAEESIRIAEELMERLFLEVLPSENVKDKIAISQTGQISIKNKRATWLSYEQFDIDYLHALMQKELLVWQILQERKATKKDTTRIFLLYGGISSLVAGILFAVIYWPLVFVVVPVCFFGVSGIMILSRNKRSKQNLH